MQDKIYLDKKKIDDFNFSEEVAFVFDDMVSRSVPNYFEIQQLIANFIIKNINKNSNIYDLGCGTGNTLILLQKLLQKQHVKLYGIDNSLPMLNIAEKKIQSLAKGEIELIYGDAFNLRDYRNAGGFILNLTLQFVRPTLRQKTISHLYNSLEHNGILILFEKLIEDEPIFTRKFIELYYDFKRENNYSNIEITNKREELENVLIPYTPDENINLLREAGFTQVTMIYKYLNFGVFIGIKK